MVNDFHAFLSAFCERKKKGVKMRLRGGEGEVFMFSIILLLGALINYVPENRNHMFLRLTCT
jgi:hypothetical protein